MSQNWKEELNSSGLTQYIPLTTFLLIVSSVVLLRFTNRITMGYAVLGLGLLLFVIYLITGALLRMEDVASPEVGEDASEDVSEE